MLFMGVAALVGAPIAGMTIDKDVDQQCSSGTLHDVTHSYALTFYVMGACIAVSGIIGFPLMRISRWEHRNDDFDEMQPIDGEEPAYKFDKDKYYVDS